MSQQINLFNPAFLKQRKKLTARSMGAGLGALALALLALVWHTRNGLEALQQEASAVAQQLKLQQARQAEVIAQLAPRQKDATLAARIAAGEIALRRLGQVSAVLERGEFGNTSGYSEYFRALARQGVAGLWLTEVSISGAGVAIGVRGRALRASLVPDFIARLGREGVMRGKTFSKLEINQPVPAAKAGVDGAAPAAGAAPFVQFHLHSAAVEKADKAEEGGE